MITRMIPSMDNCTCCYHCRHLFERRLGRNICRHYLPPKPGLTD
jgi:hypothetical protein